MLFKFIFTIKPLHCLQIAKCELLARTSKVGHQGAHWWKIPAWSATNEKECVKIEKSRRGRPGRGMVLEIRTHPDKGRGWFENPRFLRMSFVGGPYVNPWQDRN